MVVSYGQGECPLQKDSISGHVLFSRRQLLLLCVMYIIWPHWRRYGMPGRSEELIAIYQIFTRTVFELATLGYVVPVAGYCLAPAEVYRRSHSPSPSHILTQAVMRSLQTSICHSPHLPPISKTSRTSTKPRPVLSPPPHSGAPTALSLSLSQKKTPPLTLHHKVSKHTHLTPNSNPPTPQTQNPKQKKHKTHQDAPAAKNSQSPL